MISSCTCLCAKRPSVNASWLPSTVDFRKKGDVLRDLATWPTWPHTFEESQRTCPACSVEHGGFWLAVVLGVQQSALAQIACFAASGVCKIALKPVLPPTARRKRSWWPGKMPFECLATVPVRSNLLWEPGVAGCFIQTTDHTVQVEQCSVALCILLRANEMAGPSFLGNLQRSTWSTLVVGPGTPNTSWPAFLRWGFWLQPHAGWKAWWNLPHTTKEKAASRSVLQWLGPLVSVDMLAQWSPVNPLWRL